MLISHLSFFLKPNDEKIYVKCKPIKDVVLTSNDKELTKLPYINIHDLKYHEFYVNDMNNYDYAFSSKNQVTISIRFLHKLEIPFNELISCIASDTGEDFYRFLVNVKERKFEIGTELDVTNDCEEFLSNLDGFKLVINKNTSNMNHYLYKYIGQFMHCLNEEVIRSKIIDNSHDRTDYDIINKIVSLIHVEGEEFKLALFNNLDFNSDERLLLKQYNNLSINQSIISQLPSEINLDLNATDNFSSLDMRDTMLIRLLRMHFGTMQIETSGLINTYEFKFVNAMTHEHFFGFKHIRNIIMQSYPEVDVGPLKDRFLEHKYEMNYCKCHDFIVMIKALNYGYLHNLLGITYSLLPDIEIRTHSDTNDSIIEIHISSKNKRTMIIKPENIVYENFSFDIVESYYTDDNTNDIVAAELIKYF